MKRLLITGAAGGLGAMLRRDLAGFADILRLSDIGPLGEAGQGEELVPCDLADMAAVTALTQDCDGIVHLGGKAKEGSWETILNSNIIGTYNIFEAARKNGVPRIMFASSNHAIGFHERSKTLNGDTALRPDSLYGVSKCFGENLGRYYWDKFRIENVAVRIGSCLPEPLDRRMLITYQSEADFVRMIKAIFEAKQVGHTVMYGVSANKEMWWDNSHAEHIGYKPQDSSERFREAIETQPPDDPADPAVIFQGGGFARAGHFDD